MTQVDSKFVMIAPMEANEVLTSSVIPCPLLLNCSCIKKCQSNISI